MKSDCLFRRSDRWLTAAVCMLCTLFSLLQLPEALELSVMKMKANEHALVTVTDAKYAYGAAGRPAPEGQEDCVAVPPHAAPLTFDVTIVDFVNVSGAEARPGRGQFASMFPVAATPYGATTCQTS